MMTVTQLCCHPTEQLSEQDFHFSKNITVLSYEVTTETLKSMLEMKYEIKCLEKSKIIKNILTFTNEWQNSPERLLEDKLNTH